jgi:hypothetical protein
MHPLFAKFAKRGRALTIRLKAETKAALLAMDRLLSNWTLLQPFEDFLSEGVALGCSLFIVSLCGCLCIVRELGYLFSLFTFLVIFIIA